MNKMYIATLGVLLLAFHLTSLQGVQAQNTTATMTTNVSRHTMASATSGNMTTKEKNGSGRTDAFTLLLPLALAASLLHSWS